MSGQYFKAQTMWSRVPAAINAYRHRDIVGLRIHPSRAVHEAPQDPAVIFLTAHEAQAFAAWLSEQAERILTRQAKAAVRKAARLAAKSGGEM